MRRDGCVKASCKVSLWKKRRKENRLLARSRFRWNKLFSANIEWKTTSADFYEALMHIVKSIYSQFCGLCGLQNNKKSLNFSVDALINLPVTDETFNGFTISIKKSFIEVLQFDEKIMNFMTFTGNFSIQLKVLHFQLQLNYAFYILILPWKSYSFLKSDAVSSNSQVAWIETISRFTANPPRDLLILIWKIILRGWKPNAIKTSDNDSRLMDCTCKMTKLYSKTSETKWFNHRRFPSRRDGEKFWQQSLQHCRTKIG